MMNWQNLKAFKCPHCSSYLLDGVHMIHCSKCRFILTPKKYESMLMHRSEPERPQGVKKNKWQNLHNEQCPVCSNELSPDFQTGKAYLKCLTADCTFAISEQRMNAFLNDPDHLCNLFKGK